MGLADEVDVWDIESGRGIDTLRGLLGRFSDRSFRPTVGSWLRFRTTGMSGNWETTDSRLLHLLEVTPGQFSDNAALAFSPDGQRFAISAVATKHPYGK